MLRKYNKDLCTLSEADIGESLQILKWLVVDTHFYALARALMLLVSQQNLFFARNLWLNYDALKLSNHTNNLELLCSYHVRCWRRGKKYFLWVIKIHWFQMSNLVTSLWLWTIIFRLGVIVKFDRISLITDSLGFEINQYKWIMSSLILHWIQPVNH